MVFFLSLKESPSWRAMLAVVSIPSVAYFFLAVFYLPESPPWLVSKGRITEAKKVLQRLRGTEDVSGELALLAEGMSPASESTTVEEYIVTPACDIMANKEAGRDCIKLYGPNQGGVSMVAQQVSGQASMSSRSMLGLSRHGSVIAQAENLKDPLVNLFGSIHDINPPVLEPGGSRAMLMGDTYQSTDNLNAPLLSSQGIVVDRDKALGTGTNDGNLVPKNTDIGGGWKLVYKSAESGKKEGGLQRVYLRADPNVVPQQTSFYEGHDMNADGSEAFQASALVSHSVLCPKNMSTKPENAAKRTGFAGLLDIGVRRALVVGIGLQVLQQAAGINGFLYYAPQILDQAGVGALLSNFGISSTSASLLVNIVTTFAMLPCITISMRLMDVAGRSQQKMASHMNTPSKSHTFSDVRSETCEVEESCCSHNFSFMIPKDHPIHVPRPILTKASKSLFLAKICGILRDLFHMSSTLNAIVTAMSVMVYESCFCMGLGAIPNILCSEIFPTSVRGICISICSLTFWISILVVTSSFPHLLHVLGLTGVFGLFVIGCIAAWIFVYLKVPETKGMPLEVIIDFFAVGSKPE
ncbi:unnamed protein product [Sphenostylis stenocarpa]|uniref:Major facilitator superfamily (MFS) profile domain-containing protein n=1 Tax=Sphenostylis stenocarpa TaxID=92480 RepID=A0AA86VXP7_9FABA|nr:unnamed protein product [Sphenostylis stenocarpa]